MYGDTDSIFVNSNVTWGSQNSDHVKAVNNHYKHLKIDLNGIFQQLLLLQKKKYATIKIETDLRTSTEVKGLDMKHREYCTLSKSASQYVLLANLYNLFQQFFSRYVLKQILSGEATETVIELIHQYLTMIREDVHEDKIKFDEFIVCKVGCCHLVVKKVINSNDFEVAG